MAPRRRAAEASYGFFGCFVALCGGFKFRSIGDNRSTISTRSGGVLQCRAIVTNGSPTTHSGGVLWLFRRFCFTFCGGLRFRSIGDNRSTISTRSGGVLQCRDIVPNGSATTRSGGVLRLFRLFCCCLRWSQVPIDWGQSIYHFDARKVGAGH